MLQEQETTGQIIKAATEVHRLLGPGLLESIYQTCLVHELTRTGVTFEAEVPITVDFKGHCLVSAYRADLIVEDKVLVELKAVDRLMPIHEAQILTYLKLTGIRVGLLMNFNVTRLQLGIRRFVR